MRRNEIVDELGLTMINRIVVDPRLQGLGIGTAIATVAQHLAPKLYPGSRFIEVMTARSISDAEAVVQGKKENDFLQKAGFTVAPTISSRKPRHVVKGQPAVRSGMLYYFAPVK
jgi:GNAT superfamily N-acetyltransferase